MNTIKMARTVEDVLGSYASAEQEIDKLIRQHELQVVHHQEAIADARTAIKHLTEIKQRLERIQPADAGKAPATFAPRKRTRANSMAWLIRRSTYKILKSKGHPLDRVEILEALKREGLVIAGSDPAKTIGKVLWAAKEFFYFERGYWLCDEPLPSSDSLPKRRRRNSKT